MIDPESLRIVRHGRGAHPADEARRWRVMTTSAAGPSLPRSCPRRVSGDPDDRTIGSVGIVRRHVAARCLGVPRIGLEIVDVRDLPTCTSGHDVGRGRGQRFLATGEFTWMRDMARTLRAELGPDGSKISAAAARLPRSGWPPASPTRACAGSRPRSARNRHSTEKRARARLAAALTAERSSTAPQPA